MRSFLICLGLYLFCSLSLHLSFPAIALAQDTTPSPTTTQDSISTQTNTNTTSTASATSNTPPKATVPWICTPLPSNPNWCTLTLTSITHPAEVSVVDGTLYNARCEAISETKRLMWGEVTDLASPFLPRRVRILARPVNSTGEESSEFWYGDGHWQGYWDVYSPAENWAVSKREWDCSFTRGHLPSGDVAIKMTSGVRLAVLGTMWVVWSVF